MNNIGRNDPCPCGSGKKYKRCCLGADVAQRAHGNPAAEVNQALSKSFAGQQLETLEDVQVFAEYKIRQMNESPQDELGGFSPTQLQTLLYAPIEEQTLIGLRDDIDACVLVHAPVWVTFTAIRDYLRENKAKLTARGNLPRALVTFVHSVYTDTFGSNFFIDKVNKEQDFRQLHITHLLLKPAGLLRVYKGEAVLTKKALELSDGEIFKALIKAYLKRFNWGYEDGYPDVDFIQQAGLYSLVALHRRGEEPVNLNEFAEDFVRVFPAVLNEVDDNDLYSTPFDTVCRCYRLRTIERFWTFFGLVTLRNNTLYSDEDIASMTPTELLAKVFVFKR